MTKLIREPAARQSSSPASHGLKDLSEVPEELSPELARIDKQPRRTVAIGDSCEPKYKPHPRKRKPVASKDYWTMVPAWLVRAFPRQLMAAVLAAEFLSKFRKRKGGKMPLAQVGYTFQGKIWRTWVYATVAALAERMGWDRFRTMRSF